AKGLLVEQGKNWPRSLWHALIVRYPLKNRSGSPLPQDVAVHASPRPGACGGAGAGPTSVPLALELCAGATPLLRGHGQGRATAHAQQEAELPEVKAALPEYQQVHSQVLQDVLTRLDH